VTLAVEPITQGAEDYLRFQVVDHGMGIPQEDHEAVFHKFYRSSSASRKQSGTGLGLAMVKSFRRH
jgi:signal transduction histidine kinase